MLSFFTRSGDTVVAEEIARSGWNAGHIGGPGVCGLLARELENHCPAGFVPARTTVDLFRPVLDRPIRVRSEVARKGRRITVADAQIVQDDEVRARATTVFLSTGEAPPGRVWSAAHDLPVPPPDVLPRTGARGLYRSGDGDWSRAAAAHQNADRKIAWRVMPALVAGEPLSPFQHAAMVGDTTNHVCHWGDAGAGYINTDMTLTLSRLPTGYELGLRVEDSVAADGISIGTALLYDRDGALGTCVVSSLANAGARIDYTVRRR